MEGTNSEAKFSVTSIHQSVFKTHSNPQAFSAASPSSASTSSSSSFGHCNSRLPSQSLAYVNSPADGITASASVDVSDRDLFKASNRSKALDIPFLDSFPPGYRFSPFDEELIVHYLDNKVANRPLPKNKIMEVDLYSYNPEDLAVEYRHCGEKEWYFFTPRDKKYPNGSRPRRAARNGFWKATGADKCIKHGNKVVGYRKALVFYTRTIHESKKTNWIMHEYRVSNAPPRTKTSANDMRLDDWVLCRIYKKEGKGNTKNRQSNEEQSPQQLDAAAANVAMGVENESEAPGYTNTLGEYQQHVPMQMQEFPPSFSHVPPLDNNLAMNNYGGHNQAMFGALNYQQGSFVEPKYVSYGAYNIYGADMAPPMLEPIQMVPANQNVFTSRYLNENGCELKARSSEDHICLF
ncbi:hypothetical protein MANES_06G163000v8 [Manihot esculenta]|uniref:Uncharacterized protein n=1 Tax=Manihot esculenta TaxID=3983 RepID=A0ACB7HM55_MANES|nr:hypothetical protein MANES_06G163000v8 [Manihot esculenta]